MTRPGGEATILHADLDSFYASVEQLLDPSLRGKPIAVGGGVVLAASYEARVFGVSSGMAGWQARQRCPNLQFVGGHFKEYERLGDEVMDVLNDFTPLVERISIDEAFLDVGGSVHLFGSPSEIAAIIRTRVRTEIGLPISIGVARTKHLAKVASQVAKPDGLVVVEPAREMEFLEPLPVELMWGVGPVTRQRLADQGIFTIGELAAAPGHYLERLLGNAAGAKLAALARNLDPRQIELARRAASVGAQSALGRQRVTKKVVRTTLGFLVDRVATRLRKSSRAGRTITVRVRFVGMKSVTRSVTLGAAVSATLTITELATELALTALRDHRSEREITLLGVSVSQLVYEPVIQLELDLALDDQRHRPGAPVGAARWSVDKAMDAARERFGRDSVGYAATVFDKSSRVPDAFRELAER